MVMERADKEVPGGSAAPSGGARPSPAVADATSGSHSDGFSPSCGAVIAAISESVLDGRPHSIAATTPASDEGAAPDGASVVARTPEAASGISIAVPDDPAAFLASLCGSSPSDKRAAVLAVAPSLGLEFEALPSMDAVVAAQADVAAIVNDKDHKIPLCLRTAITSLVADVARQAADFRALALDSRGRSDVLRDMLTASQRHAAALRDRLVESEARLAAVAAEPRRPTFSEVVQGGGLAEDAVISAASTAPGRTAPVTAGVRLKLRRSSWLSRGPIRNGALAAVLAVSAVVHLYLQHKSMSLFTSGSTPPQNPSPNTSVVRDLHELNWTTCPTEYEFLVQQHYSTWDEKLAKQLHLSPQAIPKIEMESWHPVTADIHVYSAFLVTTEKHAIHINGIVRGEALTNESSKLSPPLVCLVRSSNSTNEYTASVKNQSVYFDPAFKTVLILCSPADASSFGSQNVQVAVTFRGMIQISLRWTQLHITSDQPKEKCCAVCVRPIYGSISLWKLAEFIAHYRLLGARSLYFYDLDMSVETKLLLGKLQAAGLDITLVRFKLLFEAGDGQSLIHCQGQMPALYDCIFRSMSKVEYYIHVDIDELIILPRHSKLTAVVHEAERSRGKEAVGSIILMMRLYCTEYPVSSRFPLSTDVPLRTRSFIYHTDDIEGGGKYIARSRAVCEPGVHFVQKHCGGAGETYSDSSVAVLGHYRRCCDRDDSVLPMCQKPLMDIRHLYPREDYLAAIENDLAIRIVRSLLPSIKLASKTQL